MMVCSRLRAGTGGVNGTRIPVDEVIIDAVLDVWAHIGLAKNALVVRFILRKKKGHLSVDVQPPIAQLRGSGGNDAHAGRALHLPQHRLGRVWPPGPGVTEPEAREHMECGRFQATIGNRDSYQDLLWGFLGILTYASK